MGYWTWVVKYTANYFGWKITKKVLQLTKLMTQIPKFRLIYKKVTKSLLSFPVYWGVESIASWSTEPNDLSSFFPNTVFPLLHTTTVVYKKENVRVQFKLFPPNLTLTQHYTQLANYHLSKFETGINGKAERRQSADLLLIENTRYKQVFKIWFKLP